MLRIRHEASKEPKQHAFPYQIEAVQSLKDLEFSAVFHEQGLGKTKIAIDLALTWLQDNVVDSVLFVTKKSLVANWQSEIRAHSFIEARVLSQDRRRNFYAFNSPARFYIMHYEACMSEADRLEVFLKTRRVAVICDEAQKFKNPESGVAKALFRLASGFSKRVILTGTPIANRPYDIWSLVKFLDGGEALGNDFRRFKRAMDLSNRVARSSSERELFEEELTGLMSKISKFSIRETKDSSQISLPSKQIEAVQVDPEERQEEIYRDLKEELRSVVVRNNVPTMEEVDAVLKRLLRLVQVASNPKLVDESYRAAPGKLPVLESIIETALTDVSAKCLVWTSFTDNVDWLTREFRRYGAVKVHGKLTIDERNSAIERFKTKEDCRVLVATPGAAKEGLTLTMANHAVFFDRGFSLDDYLQAQDRIHRISQKRTCFIYNLIMRGTVDEWVDELLGAKHLAAKLGLGDISRAEYESQATYRFAELIEQILSQTAE
jgi:SNF2 family DNA or RNA helicase